MDDNQTMTPLVFGSFTFIVAHVAQLGLPESAAIGVVSSIVAYIAVTKPWEAKKGTKQLVDLDDDDYDNEETSAANKSSSKKKKKKRTTGTAKKKKRSSYEDDVVETVKEKTEDDESALSKKSEKRKKKKAAQKAKAKAEAAKKAAEEAAKPKLSKKQRQRLRKREKEALEAKQNEEKKMLEDGWEMTKTAKKHQEQDLAKKMKKLSGESVEESTGDGPVEIYVDVPRKFHGKIIGPKGATKIMIQDETNVEIKMPKQGGASTFITIIGPAAGAKKAKEAILQLTTDGISSITHKGFITKKMPCKRLGLIIGPRGAHVKALQAATGVRINLPERDAEGPKELTLVGPAEGVQAAENAILDLCANEFCQITHPGWTKDEIPFRIDRSHMPELLGKNGSNINKIQSSTRTKVKIPNSNSINQSIVISGVSNDVQAAKEQLKALIALIQAPPVIPPEWEMNAAHNEDDDWA